MQNENDENQHNQHVPGRLPALPMERETEFQPGQQQLSRRETELKIRCGSFLSKLDTDQMQQLFRWLQEHSAPKVRLMVAAPAPEGFGLEVQETTLRRLRAHLRAGTA